MTTTCLPTPIASDVAVLRQQIVFIDAHVDDCQMLATGVLPGIEVFLLDPQRDGVRQIGKVLAARAGIDSVHIVSHGSAGSLQLGKGFLNVENLSDYAAELMSWSERLAANADLLIYGCEVALGKEGQDFIARLSELTGVSVAASSTKIGNAALGGKWQLDITTGEITSSSAFTPENMAAYGHVLANDNGGSATVGLRSATSPLLLVSQNDGTRPTLIGNNQSILFNYNSGSGYAYTDTTYAPIELYPGGAGVTSILDGVDDTNTAVSLGGASFNFNNVNYTSVFISNNGLITFGAGTNIYNNNNLATVIDANPTYSLNMPAIAVYWDDLVTLRNTNDQILYKLQDNNGDGVPDKLIVEWYKNTYYSGTGDVTFQAVLDLNTGATPGNITVNYQDLTLAVNRVPVITAEDLVGGVTELTTIPTGNLVDTGIITFTDADITDIHTVSPTGTYTGTGTALGALTAVINTDTTGTGLGGSLTWTYTALASGVEYLAVGQTKVETFNITLDDRQGGVITKTVSVTITGTNDAPALTAALATFAPGTAGTPYTITIAQMLQGYTDADAGETAALTVTAPTSPNGTFALNSGGTAYIFTPSTNFVGTVNISYSVVDTHGTAIPASQSFTIDAAVVVNHAPALTAAPATFAPATEDTPYTVTIAQLLQGYTDADAGETATLTVTAPTSTNGTFALNGAGTAYIFTPNANFNGTANISYSVVDTTGLSIAANQSFTVIAVADAPALTTAPATFSPATEDTPYTVTIAQLLQGYTDADAGETATLTVTAPTSTNGTFALNGAGTAYVFTPNANFNGTANISYSVVDTTGLSIAASQSFTVSAVADAPALTAAPATFAPATEDTPYTITIAQLLQGYTDADAGETATLRVTAPTSTNGTFALNGAGTAYVFTPNANFNGTANISYSVIDTTGLSIAASQSFTVSAVADAPALTAAPATFSPATEDAPYTITIAQLLQGYTDADAGETATLTVTAPTSTNGTFALNGAGTAYVFTPNANFNGTANISYSVVDTTGVSIAASQSFTVSAINDAPILDSNAARTILEDAAPTALNIIAPIDVEGDPLTIMVTGLPDALIGNVYLANGTLVVNGQPLTASELAGLIFTPVPNANGVSTFSYSVFDGTATSSQAISLGITAVNDSPLIETEINPTLATISEDALAPTSGIIGATIVSDLVQAGYGLNNYADADDPSAAIPGGLAITGINENGTLHFSTDGGITWQTIESGLSDSNALVLDVNSYLFFQPNADFNGDLADALTFRGWDGTGGIEIGSTTSISNAPGSPFSAEADGIAISITGVNDAPRLNADTTITILEDAGATRLSITAPSDPEDDTLTITVTGLPTGSIGRVYLANGTTVVTNGQILTAAELTGLVFTPLLNANGTAGTFSYSVSDGSLTTVQSIAFDVTAINDPLVGSPTAALSPGSEDNSYIVTAAQLLAGFSDVDTTDVINLANLTVDYGTVALNGDGTYTITPAANYNGLVTISYDVVSGTNTISGQTQSFSLAAVNDPLVGSPTAVLSPGIEDNSYIVTAAQLLAGFSDADTTDVINLANLTANHGTVALNGDGTYTITPAANYNGLVTLTYDVVSGTNTISGQTQSFSLATVNDPLVGSPTAVLSPGIEDNSYIVTAAQLLAGFSDADTTDVINLANLTADYGTVALNGDGTYTITPAANYNGLVTLTYDVVSGTNTISGQTQSFSLAAVNDPLVGSPIAVLSPGIEDNSYIVTAAQLLAGFSDADTTDVINLANLTADYGTVTLNGDGTYTITPAANYNGLVTLTYDVVSGANTISGQTQSFSLAAVNDPLVGSPTAVLSPGTEDSSYTVTAAQLIAGFSDADTTDVIALANLTINHGTIVDNGNGTYTVTPTIDYNGLVTLTYDVTSGSNTITGQTQSFSLSAVNDAPVVQGSKTITLLEDAAPTSLNITAPTDVDSPALTITVTGLPTGSIGKVYLANGTTLVTNGQVLTSAQLSGLVFKPATNANGNAGNFTYSVSDGTNTTSQAVSFAITAVNDAPLLNKLASPVLNTVAEDAVPVNGSNAGSTLISSILQKATGLNNFSDPDTDNPGGVAITNISNQGTLYFSTNNGTTWTAAVGINPANALVVGINDRILFAPNANYNGNISNAISFKSWDGHGPYSSGGYVDVSSITSSPAHSVEHAFSLTVDTAALTVTAVNDAPTTQADKSLTVQEDTLANLGITAPADVDGTTPTITVTGVPTSSIGQVYLADGTTLVANGQILTAAQLTGLVFTPVLNANGAAGAFSYSVSDGTLTASQTISLAVTAVNDPLTGTPTAVLTPGTEDSPYIVTAAQLLAGFSDPDTADAISPDSIGLGPITSSNGAVVDNGNGTYTITPGLNHNGPVTLTYSVTSGPNTINTSQTFSLTAVNDAPVADASKSLSIVEDTATPLGIVAPTDVDSASLTITVTGLPINGVLYLADQDTVVNNGDTLTGTQLAGLVFLPAPNFYGTGGTFSYTVSDGALTAASSVALSISSVNDAPVLGRIAAPTLTNILEDATPMGAVGNRVSSLIQIGSGLANFIDPDGTLPAGIAVTGVNSNGTLYYSTDNGANWNTTTGLSDSNALVLGVTARVFFKPNANFNGSVSNALTFKAWDGFSSTNGALVNTTTDLTHTFSTDSDTISINIAAVNDAPIANDDSVTVTSLNATISTASLLANDIDPDASDVLKVVSINSSNGSAVLNDNGTPTNFGDDFISYIPAIGYGYSTTDTLTYVVQDATGLSAQATVTSIANIPAYQGTSGDDYILGTVYADIMYGNDGNDYLNGGAGDNSLYGGTGNDTLDGSGNSTSLNTFAGGSGDDTYGVYNSATVITENAGEGTDTVWSAVNYTLTANVENMYLVDGADGTGNDENNIITGYGAGENIIYGLGGDDYLDGGADHDSLNGGAGNDYLSGGAGNDILDDSGDGLDTLAGGTDDDVYSIYNSDTTIIENAGEGTDTVWSTVDYTLAANVENMNLVGDIDGTGNDSNNIIVGYGAGDNNIYGLGGDDNIAGGEGNDYLNGGDGNDSLDGGTGNDILDGSGDSTGLDTFAGGSGDDIYGVYNSATVITENAGEGTDTVWSAVDYTLSANVENMYLVDGADGTGNDSSNTIIGYGAGDNSIYGLGGDDSVEGGEGNDYLNGGAGNDSLDGGAGNDILDGSGDSAGLETFAGGSGDDIYGVYNSATVIIENAGEGTDTVWSAVDYTLTANVENMYLVGNATGTGNDSSNTIIGFGAGDNTIYGLGGDDYLDGGAGNNTLTGGVGIDTFVLSAPNSGLNIVTDFATNEFLKVSNFTSLAGLTVTVGAGLSTATAANQFILDSSNGSLYFDADGVGGNNAVKLATLQGSTSLSAANFI
jgi:VCBS repeat-containing protein